MKYEIPKHVIFYMTLFETEGHECYLVGGAVRDFVMGKEPHDYDLAVNAPVGTIHFMLEDRRLVSHTAGLKFGMVAAKSDIGDIEITEFRREDKYDGRKPEIVEYTDSLEEDASRRDFTINALYMDVRGNITDLFGGQQDIKDKILRSCDDADKMLKDDHLRILRAVRFAVKYDLEIDVALADAMFENRWSLLRLSSERITEELDKMLLLDDPVKAINSMLNVGILEIVLPEVTRMYDLDQDNPNHNFTLLTHVMLVLKYIKEPNLELRWAALLHDIGKSFTRVRRPEKNKSTYYEHHRAGAYMVKRIGERLKWSKKRTTHIRNLVYCHLMPREIHRPMRLFRKFTIPYFNESLEQQIEYLRQLFELSKGDSYAKFGDKDDPLIDIIAKKYDYMVEKLTNYTDVKPLLNGYDMMELFQFQGKEIGEATKKLVEWQLERKDKGIETTRTDAICFVSINLDILDVQKNDET